MKLFKHVEVAIMLAFFLTCAIGALQLGAPGRPSMPIPMLTPAPMRSAVPPGVPTPMPTLTPLPMPVVRVIGRRLTGAEKRAATATARGG